jgi:tRNA uridine 5-carboxymethylaminomethyl modification enzyme
MDLSFDVIVIGGGHAGTEAAHAAAKMGCKTALVTMNAARIGFMSCNPAIGGLAKGQLVKEIDALGGIMGRITDRAAIQYRQLNTSKGPAVRSSRAQCDKAVYAAEMQSFLKILPNLTLLQGEADKIDFSTDTFGAPRVSGLRLRDGTALTCQSIVVTAGTFMRAIMHTGELKEAGGRAGDQGSNLLSESIESFGIKLKRLKTGTPPRIHRDSIDYSVLERQSGDESPTPFSFYHRPDPFPLLKQMDCFITYTNSNTHEVIAQNFGRSPMFSGEITGIGPRYCPSIEDKVKKFSDKDRHQLFVEPEGHHTVEMYINGISTSLPSDVQNAFVHSIVGLEKAVFLRYGYAVEYDALDSRCLKSTYESKDCKGLFFAGQVNGTSGYEEAGAQGIVAGVNAALLVKEKDPFILSRFEGYIGVLADDLVLKGADEPYRMFTSRAEHRLQMREDNADLRLSEKGHEIGLLSDDSYKLFLKKRELLARETEKLNQFFIYPKGPTQEWMKLREFPELKDRVSGIQFLKRPEVQYQDLVELGLPQDEQISAAVREQIEIQVKYEGYIKRDLDLMAGVQKNEKMKIPVSLDYGLVPGLSTEIISRLRATRPETIGQMGRMMGVTPSAVATLLIYLKVGEK